MIDPKHSQQIPVSEPLRQFWGFIHFCTYAGDVMHFQVMRPFYASEIRATPPKGEPHLIVFNRGGMIWASRGYVYDESDEVTRAGSLRSFGWKARANNTDLSCGYPSRIAHDSDTRKLAVGSSGLPAPTA